MPLTDISSAQSGNMSANVADFSVNPRNTDAAGDQEETEWINAKWSQWFAYYKEIPELKSAIDMRAIWTIGKGFNKNKVDPETAVILDHLSGNGSDTFNTILKNMVITRRINGDAYAEIIRSEDGTLINLKPLDPGSIKIIFDRKGIIKRYEQISKIKGGESGRFEVKDIFHLSNKRVADEMHGISDVEAVEKVILARNESFADMRKLMHRYVKPIMGFKIDSDDTAKIDAFAVKMDAVVNKGENIYIPKDTIEFELISVPSNSTLNPSPWMQDLKNFFYQVVGMPQILMGGGQDFTEASAKISYLAFQQSVEDEQLDIETQFWNQVYLKIELDFPASLQNELLSDQSKDAEGQMMLQASDFTAGAGR